MPRRVSILATGAKGLLITPHGEGAGPEFLILAQNFRRHPNGDYERIWGTKQAHASARASAVEGVFSVMRSGGAAHFWMLTNGAIEKGNGGPEFSSVSSIAASGQTTGQLSGVAVLNEVTYVADYGVLNKISSADVWTANIAGTPSVVKALCTYNNRLWGVDGSNLYYSSLGNGDTLGNGGSGGGAITFPGRTLVQLAVVGSSMLIFCSDAILRFQGWGVDDFNVTDGSRGVSNEVGVGSVGLNAVAVANKLAYFVGSDRRVYAASEVGLQEIGQAITGSGLQVFNPFSSRVFYSTNRDELLVTNSDTSASYLYYPTLGCWTGPVTGLRTTLRTGNQITDFFYAAQGLSGTNRDFVYLVDDTANGMPKNDKCTSAGAGGDALPCFWRTHIMPLGSLQHETAIRTLSALYTGNSTNQCKIRVIVNIVNGDQQSLPNSVAPTRCVVHIPAGSTPTLRRGVRVQLEFSNDGVSVVTLPAIRALGLEGFAYTRRVVGVVT